MASAGLFFHAFPALPCPFLFCLFDLRCPLPAIRPIPPTVFFLNVSLERKDPTRQTWTLVDQIACLLALDNCIIFLHIASPPRHSLRLLYRCSLVPAKSRVLRTTAPHFFNRWHPLGSQLR